MNCFEIYKYILYIGKKKKYKYILYKIIQCYHSQIPEYLTDFIFYVIQIQTTSNLRRIKSLS